MPDWQAFLFVRPEKWMFFCGFNVTNIDKECLNVLLFLRRVFMVTEMLKKQYKPCEPIVLNDMKWLKQSPGALRQAFKRMSDKGIVKRYMNGVYYFPDKGKIPSVDEVVKGMYIGNHKKTFGYYGGFFFGRQLEVTKKEDAYPIIVTNKENSRGRYRTIANKKVYLRKSYIPITKDNVGIVALLDFVREWEAYSELEETDTFKQVKAYLKEHSISKDELLNVAVYFPSRVSAMLVKHKLV